MKNSPFTLDTEASALLQGQMNADTYQGGVIAAGGSTECSDSQFELTDPAKLKTLATSDEATNYWYGGKPYYDFKKNGKRPKYKGKALTSAQDE